MEFFWVSARGVFVEYVVGLLVLVGFWFVVGNWVVWLVVGVVWLVVWLLFLW